MSHTGFKTVTEFSRSTVASGKGYQMQESEGKVVTAYQWTDRQPHPPNMGKYEAWGNDAEASVALEVLKNIIAGVSYYTEMPDEFKPKSPDDKPHEHKVQVDKYGEDVNLDEKLQSIAHTMLHKGFCPVEVFESDVSKYDLKLLPPETFFIWQNKKGHIYRYTQERSVGDVITTWEEKNWKKELKTLEAYYPKEEFKELMSFEAKKPSSIDDIVLFYFGWSPNRPYGKSLLEPIGELIDDRAQMNRDMPKAVHRWAYPIPIMETSGPKAALQQACENRDIDEWIFVGNVNEGEVRWNTLAIDPQARFIPYIELVYYQICEGLHAPLLLYLKNATEASATVMMESVDRLVNGVQRYIKRRVEKFLFKPQVGDPVPRLVWGMPKTGLEEISGTELAAMLPHLAGNQKLELLKQFGIELPEAVLDPMPPQPQMPFQQQPFQKKPQQEIPIAAMLEKLNDLQTSLNIIETNYKEKRIPLTQAMNLGGKTIEVYLRRLHGEGKVFEEKRQEEFGLWAKRLIGATGNKPTYKVTVD